MNPVVFLVYEDDDEHQDLFGHHQSQQDPFGPWEAYSVMQRRSALLTLQSASDRCGLLGAWNWPDLRQEGHAPVCEDDSGELHDGNDACHHG